MSFAEIVEELHRLREENAALRTQVGMLSDIGASGGAKCNGSASPNDSDATTSHDLEHAAAVTCLATELRRVEASAEHGRVSEAVAREELAMRCQELGSALEQRVLQAEQAQQAAVAAAQQQSAASVAALEEQLAAMADEAARREALADVWGTDTELAEAEQRTLAAVAQCEHKAAEVARLQQELGDLKAAHASEQRSAEERACEAEAAAAEAKARLAAHDGVVHSLEGQLVRLSEGFNKQVEEVITLQQQLHTAKAATVDKAVARSWIVNYVESGNSARGEEMLRLMAEWWQFGEADLQRVGLSAAPHPEREYRTGLSWTDAFATFLDEEAQADEPHARPAPRSPSSARASREASMRLSREVSLSESARAEPPIA